eukprot:TRINITY_DN5440_c0_g1_i3.p1 TRINITY_DN5440_c0_g1~~TRINITY_DN5440_c0_g1_i3.p1  ORF type:complete len:449 (-),score=130.20 TRINITY_DN5440_c0_g1_i3:12-1358(-)
MSRLLVIDLASFDERISGISKDASPDEIKDLIAQIPEQKQKLTGWTFGANDLVRPFLSSIPEKAIVSHLSREGTQQLLESAGLIDVGWSFIWSDVDPAQSSQLQTHFGAVSQNKISFITLPTSQLLKSKASFPDVEFLTFGLEKSLTYYVGGIRNPDEWSIVPAKYLESKNVVDREAMSGAVWESLSNAVADIQTEELRVLEIGAGNISMLNQIKTLKGHFHRIKYAALEREKDLIEASCAQLEKEGYTRSSENPFEFETVLGDTDLVVDLIQGDFFEYKADPWAPYHVIIGCCFADLFMPDPLLDALMRISPKALVYLPITFSGETRLVPPLDPQSPNVPSDDIVIEAYTRGMIKQGQNLDVPLLVSKIKERGGSVISQAPSWWKIDPERESHRYFWECMFYFIGMGVTLDLYPKKYDIATWIRLHHEKKSKFEISNDDLLVLLPGK